MNYEKAIAATERGEKVEVRPRLVQFPEWRKFSKGDRVLNDGPDDFYEFRLAPGQEPDPYAEFKAAQKAGKTIQVDVSHDDSGVWEDAKDPELLSYGFPPHCYRVKPEEPALVIEPGKAYRNKSGEKVIVLSKTSRHHAGFPVIGEVYEGNRVLLTKLYRSDGSAIEDKFSLIAPWTDAPVILDNWRHVPSWANWQAMDRAGEWCFFQAKPIKGENAVWFGDTQYWSALPPEYAPTNFTGTWETSLQERPETQQNGG